MCTAGRCSQGSMELKEGKKEKGLSVQCRLGEVQVYTDLKGCILIESKTKLLQAVGGYLNSWVSVMNL